MGTSVLGRLGIVLESLANPGEQIILNTTAISALPASVTTQPNAISGSSAYSGARLLIVVQGNTASGTITVAGKDFSQAQNSVSETTPTFAAAGSASNPTGTSEYTTIQTFDTINASGVTVSGLTGGTVKIYAIDAVRFLLPAMADMEEKFPPHSPQEQRGLMSRDTAIEQLVKVVDISKIEQMFYPDNCTWLPFATTGASPFVIPLPSLATQIKAAAAVSTAPYSIAAGSQPNVIGTASRIQFVTSGNSATGTITVAGTNIAGTAITEALTIPGSDGTFTTNNSFATINSSGITISGMTGAATVQVLALSGQVKASYAVAGGATSLTTQPNTIGPDSILMIVASGSSAVGTVVVAGTNRLGMAISETVQCGVPGAANGNGTFYTNQAFSTVNASGVSFTGLTSGSVIINAVPGFSGTWLAGPSSTSNPGGSDQLYSVTIEWYTGTDAVTLPFSFFTEATLEWGVEKETKWTAKGMAQDMLAIGNRATTPLTASTAGIGIGAIGGFNDYWQPFDVGLAGWQVAVFIDALSGTPGTTAYNQVLDGKVTFKTPQKASYPAVNWQRFQKVYRQQRETDLELTIDFIDLVQYEQFRQNFVKQLVQLQFIGPYIGSTLSTVFYKQWAYTFAAKILEAKRDPSKMEKVEAKFKLKCEYSSLLGYDYKLVMQNQQPPIYNS